MIRVVVREPGRPAENREIGNSVNGMQTAIGGGLLEVVQRVHGLVEGAEIVLFVDEMGAHKRLSPNVYWKDGFDPLFGVLLIVKVIDGNEVSMTDDNLAIVLAFANELRPATATDN